MAQCIMRRLTALDLLQLDSNALLGCWARCPLPSGNYGCRTTSPGGEAWCARPELKPSSWVNAANQASLEVLPWCEAICSARSFCCANARHFSALWRRILPNFAAEATSMLSIDLVSGQGPL